jgi:oligopeptide transport system substrate-binding protein
LREAGVFGDVACMLHRLLPAALCLFACVCMAQDGATLERGNGPEPDTLDAHRAQTLAAFNILRDLYEGLVAEDAQGRLIPGIARSWTVSADGREWTFVLREGLRWSDGSALDAPQVAAALRRAVDPATLAPYASLLSVIVGADAISAGHAAPATLGIETPDARHLLIHLQRPAPLDRILTLPIAFPVSLPGVAAHGPQHTRPGNLVSNGPYRLVEWRPQAAVLLERNPHWRDAAQLSIQRVRFHVTEDAASELKRYLAGDLHLTETVPPGRLDRLRARFGTQLRISPYLGSFWFGLNLRRPPFRAAPALRRALVLALDRDILTRHVTGLGEQPAWTIVPPGIEGYAPALPAWAAQTQAQREAQARALYAQAGYSADAPLALELRYNTSTQHRRLALAVASMWRQVLGVRTRLINEEWKVFVGNRRQGTITQAFRGGWVADYADPASFLSTFAAHQPLNTGGFDDSTFDSLLQQAADSADGAARNALYHAAEQRLVDADVVVPIYHYTSKHLVDPRVEGFTANPLDRHPTRDLRLREPAQ